MSASLNEPTEAVDWLRDLATDLPTTSEPTAIDQWGHANQLLGYIAYLEDRNRQLIELGVDET